VNQLQKPSIHQHAFKKPLSYKNNMRKMLKLTAGNKAKTWNRKWIETKTDVNAEVADM
jgi:hypothetical protein